MKNNTILTVLVAALVAALATGCSSKATGPEVSDHCKINGESSPLWVCKPHIDEDSYSAVGFATHSSAGFGHMRKAALVDGRSNLAHQIQTHVKDKVETFVRSTGADEGESVDKVITSVSKQVAKIDLSYTKEVDMWVAESGDLYLLIGAPKFLVNPEVKTAIKSSYKSDEALWQQFQAKQSLESLEKEFDTKE
jgi:hypothetical protein